MGAVRVHGVQGTIVIRVGEIYGAVVFTEHPVIIGIAGGIPHGSCGNGTDTSCIQINNHKESENENNPEGNQDFLYFCIHWKCPLQHVVYHIIAVILLAIKWDLV